MSQERIPCTYRSSPDLALKTGCTKPLPSLPLRVPSEYDSTGSHYSGASPRDIEYPSGSPHPSSPVDSLEALLSNLHLETAKPELPATDPDRLTKKIPPPEASSELKPRPAPVTPLATCKKASSPSNDAPIRPITGSATCRTLGFQIPLMQRGVSDDSMFLFDSDMNMPTSPGSMISDREDTQFNFGSLPSIEENSRMTSYSQGYNTIHQQQTRMDLQQAPFQSTNFAPANTMPVNNRMSLLSQHLKSQGYQTYNNPVVTTRLPLHHFMGSSLNLNEQDQYVPLKFDDDLDLLLLSPGPEVTLPTSDWSFDQSQVHKKPIPIGVPPTNKFHQRTASLSNSVRPQHHPYRSPSYGGATLGTSAVGHVAKNFPPHQQQAALNIFNYKQAHPDTAIPASYITAELAEVYEGRGWCLLGNCGVDRAKQKLNPIYDVSKDTTRKRLDHLYDHIRDKHFDFRPFRCAIPPCTRTFSREHDLKRHEKTHIAVPFPCEVCGKQYTREDNLRRHAQLKHFSVPGTNRGLGGASFPY